MLMTETSQLSERQSLQRLYEPIMQSARPGDVLFFISDTTKPACGNYLSRVYRGWLGFNWNDASNWHTTLYVGAKKESKGGKYRPYIIHSHQAGTTENLVPPGFMLSKRQNGQTQSGRIEILQNPNLDDGQRENIVQYCRTQLGKPFDDDERWSRNLVTYVLGLKSLPRDSAKVSCHGLAFEAYARAGLSFPHQLSTAPNLLGRLFGHPLGHPPDRVDLRSNYLRDHQLYQNPLFEVVLALSGGGHSIRETKIERYPGKYSWDAALQKAYGCSVAPQHQTASRDTLAVAG